MTARRYAVINASNIVVNVITIDDPMPANYWPGYGQYLCYQGPARPGEQDTAYTYSSPLSQFPRTPIFGGQPTFTLQIGDFVNPSTGVVLRFVQSTFVQDGVTVASAPSIKLVDDANVRP